MDIFYTQRYKGPGSWTHSPWTWVQKLRELKSHEGTVGSICCSVAERAVDTTRSQQNLHIWFLSSSLTHKTKTLHSTFLKSYLVAILVPPRSLYITNPALFSLLNSTPLLSEGLHQESIEKAVI